MVWQRDAGGGRDDLAQEHDRNLGDGHGRGLADLGYLVFVDLPGYVNFVPGTIMTFISGAAIVLSFWVWLRNRSNQTSAG